MDTKICTKCGFSKELKEFHNAKGTKDGKCYQCIECGKKYYNKNRDKVLKRMTKYRINNKEIVNERHRQCWEKHKEKRIKVAKLYYLKNKKQIKNISLQNKFGITTEQYEEMLQKQNGVCAICNHPEVAKHKSGITLSLAVDHNHITGQIRGLLCHKCNRAIGLLRDDINIIKKTVKYLENNNEK